LDLRNKVDLLVVVGRVDANPSRKARRNGARVGATHADRLYSTEYLPRTGDLAGLQRLLRNADIRTTMR
jgi:hypothetical protein